MLAAGDCEPGARGPSGLGLLTHRTQDAYGVRYLRYWVDEASGKVFCLVEAPDADAAATVHREAHGLVADNIFEVIEGE